MTTAIVLGGMTFLMTVCGWLALSSAHYFMAGLFLAVAGLLYLLLRSVVTRVTVMFNRPEGFVAVRTTDFKGTNCVVHRLSNVDAAIAQIAPTGQRPSSRLALILDSGMDEGTHPVTSLYEPGEGPARTARQINAWLSGKVDSAAPAL